MGSGCFEYECRRVEVEMILTNDIRLRLLLCDRDWIFRTFWRLFLFSFFYCCARCLLLQAQTAAPVTFGQAPNPEIAITQWLEELRKGSFAERIKIAERLARSPETSLTFENDPNGPLVIIQANTRSVEISSNTRETPLYALGLSFRIANNTERQITRVNWALFQMESGMKELSYETFHSINGYGTLNF
jgi:hypothetical protein